MTILRAALYERVSTEEQALRGFSIDAQIDSLTEYCEKNKIKIVDHYTDEGISGAKPPLKRPALQRLLEDVQAGKIDIILFTKLDRWFRSVKEYFKVQEILDKYRVQWKTIYEDYDTTTANGQMSITIFLAIAQNERDRTAERVKMVLEHKRKNKEACFGGQAVPWGYIKQKDEDGISRLVKDPKTREATQEFWDILIAYNNLNKAIRQMVNVYGIDKDWKSWKRITQSDFYCGNHRGIEDFCEPYVTVEDFLRYHENRPIKATPTGRTYLFRGLIRCPECGHKLAGHADKRPNGEFKNYRCVYRGRGCGSHAAYAEKKTEKQLLARLQDFLIDEIATIEAENAKPKPKPKTNISALKERLRRLEVVYMAGNKPDSEYLKEQNEIKALIAKAENESPPPARDVAPLKELLATDFRSIYDTFTDEEKQRFWLGLIKEIKFDGRDVKDIIFF